MPRFFKKQLLKNETTSTESNAGTPPKNTEPSTENKEQIVSGTPCPDCDGTGLLDHATMGNAACKPCPKCDASGTI